MWLDFPSFMFHKIKVILVILHYKSAIRGPVKVIIKSEYPIPNYLLILTTVTVYGRCDIDF